MNTGTPAPFGALKALRGPGRAREGRSGRVVPVSSICVRGTTAERVSISCQRDSRPSRTQAPRHAGSGTASPVGPFVDDVLFHALPPPEAAR